MSISEPCKLDDSIFSPSSLLGAEFFRTAWKLPRARLFSQKLLLGQAL